MIHEYVFFKICSFSLQRLLNREKLAQRGKGYPSNVYSPHCYKGQNWADPKPGTSSRYLTWVWRVPRTWAIVHRFPRPLAESWIGSGDRTQTSTHMGLQLHGGGGCTTYKTVYCEKIQGAGAVVQWWSHHLGQPHPMSRSFMPGFHFPLQLPVNVCPERRKLLALVMGLPALCVRGLDWVEGQPQPSQTFGE